MVKKDYHFVVPIAQSEWLEVTAKFSQLQVNGSREFSQYPAERSIEESNELGEFNYLHPHLRNEHLIKVMKAAYEHVFSNDRTFMIPTATGFQLLRSKQIVLFEYLKNKKQWIVRLNNQTQLQLKRNTAAEDILHYSHTFVRVNQQHILNLDYLNCIVGRECKLCIPMENEPCLIISRSYFKALQERVEII